MHPLKIGKNYCLRLPDGRALGHVRIERFENSWAEGPWTPDQAFEEHRLLFEKEAELRHDQIIPLWEKTADAIESLGIQIVEEGQNVIQSRFRIFIEGNEAIIGSPVAS